MSDGDLTTWAGRVAQIMDLDEQFSESPISPSVLQAAVDEFKAAQVTAWTAVGRTSYGCQFAKEVDPN